MEKKICATCKKEIEIGEEYKGCNYTDGYWEEVFHEECLEKEYEYAEDKGTLG